MIFALSAGGAVPTLGPPPAAPDDLFLWALARETGQDGVTATRAVLAADYAAACAGGQAAACSPESWRDGDGAWRPDTLVAALRPRCEAGNAAACVAVGWGLGPGPAAIDPFRTACSAGIARGCTELGRAEQLGAGTYASTLRANVHWRDACAHGEAQACRQVAAGHPADEAALVRRAIHLGHPAALADLAPTLGVDAPEAYERACAEGVGRACLERAATAVGAEAVRWTEKACATGATKGCTAVAVARVVADPAAREGAVRELSALCPRDEEACDEAVFLAAGVPAVLWYGGVLPDVEIARTLADLRAPSHACVLRALAHGRVPDAVDVHWRVESDGSVRAVRVLGADEGLADCLAAEWRKATFRAPRGGPVGLGRTWSTTHTAEIEVDANDGGENGDELHVIAVGVRARSEDLERCWVENEDTGAGATYTASVRALRDGTLRSVVPVEHDLTAEGEACVTAVLSEIQLADAVQIPTRARVRVSFGRPGGEPAANVVRPPPWEAPTEPVTMRVLVVTYLRSEVAGDRGRLTEASEASVVSAHQHLATYVEQHSRGGLVLDQTFVTRDVEVSAGRFEQQQGIRRWNLDPSELPDDLYAEVEEGGYDGVFVYLPIPPGFPRPALGVTFQPPRSQRAIFSSGAIANRGILHANDPAPAFELPLHELYHQLEYQAARRLGLDLPSNHLPLRVEGRTLSAATWAFPNPHVLDWYDEVLGRLLHPDLYRDLFTPDRSDVGVGDQALTAHPGPAPVERPDRLIDGTTFGPPSRTDDPAGGFVLEWPGPVAIDHVTAHLSAVPGGPPPSGPIELSARIGGAWRSLAQVTPGPSPTTDFSFPEVEVEAIRVGAAGTAEPELFCREIEARSSRAADDPIVAPANPAEGTLRHHSRGLQSCYEAALRRDASVAGRIEVSWTVELGTVRGDPIVISDTTQDPRLTRCVVDQIRGWTFPTDVSGELRWPFLFRTSDE